ncbi:hypothetical protein N9Y26_00465 [bacterium]|nr:hypothetical protein [bacterium]
MKENEFIEDIPRTKSYVYNEHNPSGYGFNGVLVDENYFSSQILNENNSNNTILDLGLYSYDCNEITRYLNLKFHIELAGDNSNVCGLEFQLQATYFGINILISLPFSMMP